ncbi:hypothetical protein N7510_008598 [Penicillium lagena]|uniref:uncharacterized protein n=1 Tax=Penicillium lagena TaxID=94218 RepID=UPI0025407032|nr:uncharacterized protein N7510_008598 [Penicillium lagena]KAJ5605817.1 hypothetical protein N7510_008598 [Penicillium lagena]
MELRSTSTASHSSSSAPLSSEISSVESQSGDPLAQLADEVNQHPFTSRQGLQNSLKRRHQQLRQDATRDQYLVFTSVPPAVSSRLSDEQSRTSKYCRFSYNETTGILIAKVMMLSPAHEHARSKFGHLVDSKLDAMNIDEVWSLGSATVRIGNWTKQADCCWAPSPTLASLSFVVEVGLSESTRRLALDAHGWLETSSSPVKVVVTITIKHENPEVILRRWEPVPRSDGVRTRSYTPLAHNTATIKLSRSSNTASVTGESDINGTTTTTTQLDLPFDKIVGRPPHHPLERDIVITEQELVGFAERIWRLQGVV